MHNWEKSDINTSCLAAFQQEPCVADDDHPAGHAKFLNSVFPSLGRGPFPGNVTQGIKKDEGVKKDSCHWCELRCSQLSL